MRNAFLYLLLLVSVSSCNTLGRKLLCKKFDAIELTGPAQAVVDSSFELKATELDGVNYFWVHDYLNLGYGDNVLEVTDVSNDMGGTYTLSVSEGECGKRTLTHNIEVIPRVIETPCLTDTHILYSSLHGYCTIKPSPFSVNAGSSHGPAISGYYGLDIELPYSGIPESDDILDMGAQTGTKKARVSFSAPCPATTWINSSYTPTGNNNKLYIRLVPGGIEYSFCNATFIGDSNCGNDVTIIEAKFVVPY